MNVIIMPRLTTDDVIIVPFVLLQTDVIIMPLVLLQMNVIIMPLVLLQMDVIMMPLVLLQMNVTIMPSDERNPDTQLSTQQLLAFCLDFQAKDRR